MATIPKPDTTPTRIPTLKPAHTCGWHTCPSTAMHIVLFLVGAEISMRFCSYTCLSQWAAERRRSLEEPRVQ